MSEKKKRSYRSRISSKKEQARVAEKALETINPPEWMDKKALKFFDHVIARKATVDWNPHDIDIAAQLATKEYQSTIIDKRINDHLYSDESTLKSLMQMANGIGSLIIRYRCTLNIHQTSYGSSAQRAGQRANKAAKLEQGIKLVAEGGKYLD